MAKTILIVDDSATIRMSVRTNLELAGFAVESADDGLKALAQLEAGLTPDLIITDINMPNMDGLTLIKKVRELAQFRFLPILTLTTEGQAGKREQGKKMGVTGWLVKPVGGGDLLRIIKQVLPGA
jgi:two-component system chemotaxis response regulator CheY